MLRIPALTFQEGSLVVLAERRSRRDQHLGDGGNGGFSRQHPSSPEEARVRGEAGRRSRSSRLKRMLLVASGRVSLVRGQQCCGRAWRGNDVGLPARPSVSVRGVGVAKIGMPALPRAAHSIRPPKHPFLLPRAAETLISVVPVAVEARPPPSLPHRCRGPAFTRWVQGCKRWCKQWGRRRERAVNYLVR